MRRNDIAEVGQSRGEIPVVEFGFREPNIEEFIRQAFDQILVDMSCARLKN
jgi:hypothetical protein